MKITALKKCIFKILQIFFKMDVMGNGVLVEQERFHLAMGVHSEHFSMDKFRHMCILSGCDYLPSLPGIGLTKACKFIKKTVETDIHKVRECRFNFSKHN